MWLAEHEGRMIAGDLNFVLHGTDHELGQRVARKRAKSLAPNNLLHANAMREGVPRPGTTRTIWVRAAGSRE